MKTIKVGNSEVEVSYTHKLFSGYGHYRVYGEARIVGARDARIKLSFVTDNMFLIDELNREGTTQERIDEITDSFVDKLTEQYMHRIDELVSEYENQERDEDNY